MIMLIDLAALLASVAVQHASLAQNRYQTAPLPHLSIAERVRLAFGYSELVSGEFRQAPRRLCHEYGLRAGHLHGRPLRQGAQEAACTTAAEGHGRANE